MDLPKEGPTRSSKNDRSGNLTKKMGVVRSKIAWKAKRGANTSHQERVMVPSNLLASKLMKPMVRGKEIQMTNRKPLNRPSSLIEQQLQSQYEPTTTSSRPSTTR